MDKSRRARGRMRPRVHRRGCGNVAMKKARGEIARASDAVLMNTEFVEDSVTRSQAFSRSRAKKMRSPCKQQEKNRESGMRIQRPALSHKRLCGTLLPSLPLAVFISLGNALARRCNLSRRFWFR